MQAGRSVISPPKTEQAVVIDKESFDSLNNLFSYYDQNSLEARKRMHKLEDDLSDISDKIRKINAEISTAQVAENVYSM